MKIINTYIVLIKTGNVHFDDEYYKIHELENGNFIAENWQGKLESFNSELARKLIGIKQLNTNQIRYVGKTQNELYKRLSGHYRDKRRNYKTHWINSLKAKKQKPIIKVIENFSPENWQERKKFWISEFRKLGTQLTN